MKMVTAVSQSQPRICRQRFRLTFSYKMNDQNAQGMPDETRRKDQLKM